VFKSVDGGVSWAASSPGLLPNTVKLIEFSPAYASDATIFLGTDHGAFRSTDRGATWQFLQHLNRYEEDSDLILFAGKWRLYAGPELQRAAPQVTP